ncbi:MAG: hypothetical protein M1822_005724 [Bathelium mastoideum]|nr:MAG: hypothetical protein M1822_005724 [Bathelium mastoideum]
MDHKYTNAGLGVALLKGKDYHRVQCAAQSCAEHGGFFVLLANMVRRDAHESEDEEPMPDLTHVVDLKGNKLSLASALSIPEYTLLRNVWGWERAPDAQEGGGYVGNESEEEDRFYYDTVMLLVPRHQVMPFLLGDRAPVNEVRELIGRLKKRVGEEKDDPTAKEFIIQICQNHLSTNHDTEERKNTFIGTVASTAVLLRNAELFSKAVKKTTDGFDGSSYYALGELICIQHPIVPENDIIEALTKGGRLYKITDNLKYCLNGFLHGNVDRADSLEIQYLQRWLDSLLFQSLNDVTNAHPEDAAALVKIIVNNESDKFRQFAIYQGVKKFIHRFLQEESLINALVMELLIYSRNPGPSQRFIGNLFRYILESAVSNFKLERYFTFVKAHYISPGLIKDFYEQIPADKESIRSELLIRIQAQAPALAQEQIKHSLLPLIQDMMTVPDFSSSEAQGFFQSLFITYITRFVGEEPKKPVDWTGTQRIVTEAMILHSGTRTNCESCLRIKEFLNDPRTETLTVASEFKASSHLREPYTSGFGHLKHQWDEQTGTSTLTKTLRWWENAHREWEDRASSATSVIKQLPQDRLKECLSQQYDDLTSLRVLRVDYESTSHESVCTVQNPGQVGFIVPQKRQLSDA